MESEAPKGMTYGRSRLLLGVSAVGTWVVIASLALGLRVPSWVAEHTESSLVASIIAIAFIAVLALIVQSPFDLLGGYLLPKKHRRTSVSFGMFAAGWLRGAATYTAATAFIGVAMLLASRVMGVPGLIVTGWVSSLVLLAGRMRLAKLFGGLRDVDHSRAHDQPDTRIVDSPDVGFTGGIEGVFRPRFQFLPLRWTNALDRESLRLALRRREKAVSSGLWRRGRFGALAFVWAGITIAGSQVGPLAGTAGGLLEFAAVFTIWSFAGLLVLPTLSRRASRLVDARVIEQGTAPEELASLASSLDRMQDDEPDRPAWIEAIFHPIPNASSREASPKRERFAAWDIARTAAFLGMSGLSPLGRAVHCNCGRPSLWAYLPLD